MASAPTAYTATPTAGQLNALATTSVASLRVVISRYSALDVTHIDSDCEASSNRDGSSNNDGPCDKFTGSVFEVTPIFERNDLNSSSVYISTNRASSASFRAKSSRFTSTGTSVFIVTKNFENFILSIFSEIFF